jgi:hypothetical protein
MPKYSRVKRFENLRRQIQNEGDADLSKSDLSQVSQHLGSFDVPGTNVHAGSEKPENYDPIHARRFQETISETEQTAAEAPAFNEEVLRGQDREIPAFNNEYVSNFLKDAKQYNVDHGNAYTTNTDLNLLRILQYGEPAKKQENAPAKPYPDTDSKAAAAVAPAAPAAAKSAPVQTASRPVADTTEVSDFLDSLDDEDDVETGETTETTGMTREDIAAEVQNLIKGNSSAPKAASSSVSSGEDSDSSVEDLFQTGTDTRRRILQETSQMRAQLDDYQDNLNDVSDKMKRTNRVLNGVLIVLIVALSVVLVVVVYWVLQSRGIL